MDVDKDELLKALKYDRQQYNKGFEDGVKELAKYLRDKSNQKTGEISVMDIPNYVKEWCAEYIEHEVLTTDTPKDNKIKAINPQIVVSGETDKPYYSISYYDTAKKEWFIGYGTYNLEYVRKWLNECFEEVKADVVEVVRCKDCKKYELMASNNQHFCNKYGGYVNENDYCSRCEKINSSASI